MVIAALNRIEARYRVLSFLDDDPETHGRSCCGLPVLGGRELLVRHPEAGVLAVPGSPSSYRRRTQIIASLELAQERFLTIIHPSVTVADDAVVGFNTLIMQGCTVSVDARVGNHCVILPNSVVSHDAWVGDGTQVGSNVSISGGVRIGRGCYVGSGSCFREGGPATTPVLHRETRYGTAVEPHPTSRGRGRELRAVAVVRRRESKVTKEQKPQRGWGRKTSRIVVNRTQPAMGEASRSTGLPTQKPPRHTLNRHFIP